MTYASLNLNRTRPRTRTQAGGRYSYSISSIRRGDLSTSTAIAEHEHEHDDVHSECFSKPFLYLTCASLDEWKAHEAISVGQLSPIVRESEPAWTVRPLGQLSYHGGKRRLTSAKVELSSDFNNARTPRSGKIGPGSPSSGWWCVLLSVLLSLPATLSAQETSTTSSSETSSPETSSPETQSSAEPAVRTLADLANKPQRWLVVVCGLTGDEEHRERLTTAVRQIATVGADVLGVPPDQRIVLTGDPQMSETLKDDIDPSGVSSAETIEQALGGLTNKLDSQAECWVIVMGHSNLYGRRSLFNVEGPDIDQDDFAEMVHSIQCSRKVIWITTPVSGFWLRPLADDHSVLISATVPDLEFTGTEMPYALADILSGQSQHQPLADLDQDGQLSLLDLYLAVNAEITARFQAIERLQTEHAQLDDDGDGRGRELQNDFLSLDSDDPDQRGSRKIVKQSLRDGKLAREMLIRKPKAVTP